MIYTKEFEVALSKFYKEDFINDITNSIEQNEHNKVRILLEDSLDDKIMYEKGKIREVYKNLFKGRKITYSLFMNEYIKHLDAYNNRRR